VGIAIDRNYWSTAVVGCDRVESLRRPQKEFNILLSMLLYILYLHPDNDISAQEDLCAANLMCVSCVVRCAGECCWAEYPW